MHCPWPRGLTGGASVFVAPIGAAATPRSLLSRSLGATFTRGNDDSASTVEGRWTARDPIGLQGGVNVYAFVGNQPSNALDPTGLDMQSPAAHKRDYVKGEGTIPADGMCVYECTTGFLYNHTWVQFDYDPQRSYGMWPSPWGPGPLAVMNPFGPGWFRTDDDSLDSPSCNPGPPTCREATDAEEAAVERHLIEEFASRPHFAGISDCRAVADEAIRALDRIQDHNKSSDSVWKKLLRILLGTSLLTNQH
ncbi:MAG: RHS repeat-associated core domain-containing protein [Polyangiaceae bacterium]